ncbi:MAG: glycosyltransferase family 2 protein [bacterium]|nr:glycosyltransferase family 2 protein [bacterium]
MSKIDFSLVLACYNEGPTLTRSLEKIEEVLENTRYGWEMICIDDASKDNTFKHLLKFAKGNSNVKALSHKKNVGRGGTVAEGMKMAKGRVIGYIDVDLENSPVYIPEFIREIDRGADVAIATRIEVGGMSAFAKYIAGHIYIILTRVLLGLNFKDTEAGYKFFNRRKILPVLKKVEDKRWFFDTEIVARSFRAGLKIREIPILCIMRREKKSTVNLIPDSIEYLKKILLFKFRSY